MGKQFFSGWQLWQQMTFVLACGIVATIFAGLCKLQYDKRKMKNYSKVEKGKQAQKQTPEMLEAQREETQDDIPFGIRAIESGIEVDGVWISRSNTPVGSSRSSMTGVQLPRSYNNSQFELPHIPNSSRNSSRAPSSFDVAVNAERITTNGSRTASPTGRTRTEPPSQCCSHCGHSNPVRNSTTLQALEGGPIKSGSSSVRREPVGEYHVSSAASSGKNSGKSSPRYSDESEGALPETRPYEPAYINPSTRQSYMAVASDPRTDLDALQTHRLSHVAETGQLTPRVRRPGNNGDAMDNLRSPQEISSSNGVEYFVPQLKTPSPPLPSLPPLPQLPNTVPEPVPSSSADNTQSASQAKQAVPLLETYAQRPFYLPEAYQPRGPHNLHAERSYDEVPIEVLTQQNQREDQVLRKVNSGFEILRPGTFQPPSPEEEEHAANMGDKRQSKRLQKKRRTSSGSRTSHFVEQV